MGVMGVLGVLGAWVPGCTGCIFFLHASVHMRIWERGGMVGPENRDGSRSGRDFLTYFVKINLKNRDRSRFGGDFLTCLGKYLIKTRSIFLSM